MPLIDCPECGDSVSDTAHQCTTCQYSPTLKEVMAKGEPAPVTGEQLTVVAFLMVAAFFFGTWYKPSHASEIAPGERQPSASSGSPDKGSPRMPAYQVQGPSDKSAPDDRAHGEQSDKGTVPELPKMSPSTTTESGNGSEEFRVR